MKLSEAIRLGAMLRPKSDGFFFRDGSSCAQGAALEACGVDMKGLSPNALHGEMESRWPWASMRFGRSMQCPACAFTSCAAGIIAHLNNSSKWGAPSIGEHDWTREQIADWVEQIEQQHEPAPVETSVATEV